MPNSIAQAAYDAAYNTTGKAQWPSFTPRAIRQ
jgi:hypothetical protein